MNSARLFAILIFAVAGLLGACENSELPGQQRMPTNPGSGNGGSTALPPASNATPPPAAPLPATVTMDEQTIVVATAAGQAEIARETVSYTHLTLPTTPYV